MLLVFWIAVTSKANAFWHGGESMLSSSFDISEFIEKAKGLSGHEIILMAHQEATEAERCLYRQYPDESRGYARTYATQLKDVVLYMRHGIRTQAVRQIDLCALNTAQRH
jgi:hypothetical protein